MDQVGNQVDQVGVQVDWVGEQVDQVGEQVDQVDGLVRRVAIASWMAGIFVFVNQYMKVGE